VLDAGIAHYEIKCLELLGGGLKERSDVTQHCHIGFTVIAYTPKFRAF
jgi:hypothetical protein